MSLAHSSAFLWFVYQNLQGLEPTDVFAADKVVKVPEMAESISEGTLKQWSKSRSLVFVHGNEHERAKRQYRNWGLRRAGRRDCHNRNGQGTGLRYLILPCAALLMMAENLD